MKSDPKYTSVTIYKNYSCKLGEEAGANMNIDVSEDGTAVVSCHSGFAKFHIDALASAVVQLQYERSGRKGTWTHFWVPE